MRQRQRTIRELGGEVWAELMLRPPDSDPRLHDAIVDTVMGVLARHLIVNDEDLLVSPLPVSLRDDTS